MQGIEPIFKDDNLMLRLNIVHKVHKWLQREKQGYASVLHRRIGVGLTASEFDWCIKMLEVTNCCTVTTGDKGAVILTSIDTLKTEAPKLVG
jgi:hypothetical protein